MKTLVILSEIPDEYPKFAVVNEDLFHLNGVYVNQTDDIELENDLLERFYGGMEGTEGLSKIFTSDPPIAPFDFGLIIHYGFYL